MESEKFLSIYFERGQYPGILPTIDFEYCCHPIQKTWHTMLQNMKTAAVGTFQSVFQTLAVTKDFTTVWITTHNVCDYTAKGVKTLAHICGTVVVPVPEAVCQTKHGAMRIVLLLPDARDSCLPECASLYRLMSVTLY